MAYRRLSHPLAGRMHPAVKAHYARIAAKARRTRNNPVFANSGKTIPTRADRYEMQHLYQRGFLARKHYTAYRKAVGLYKPKSRSGGGGSSSRSEAARKAWVTRRGH